MRIVWLLMLAGCYAGATSEQRVVTASARPREGYRVAPRELGDPDVLARIRHHAWLGRKGPGRLTLGGHSMDRDPLAREAATFEPPVLVDVIGEARDALRVISEEDDARVAVWIARGDVVPTIVAPSELADGAGHADPAHGVFVAPGAGIHQSATHGGRIEVSLTDTHVHARGWVDERAVGTVWLGDRPVDDDESDGGEKAAAGTRLPGAEPIREQPVATAREVARTEIATVVKRLGTSAGWVEIELVRPFVRVVGWVPAAAFEGEIADYGVLGHGGGTGYGVSDTDHFDVPAGTCLYDLDSEEVVGVNLTSRVRLGFWPRDSAFARVYVNTDWGLVTLRIRSGAPADRDHPAWESCLSVRP